MCLSFLFMSPLGFFSGFAGHGLSFAAFQCCSISSLLEARETRASLKAVIDGNGLRTVLQEMKVEVPTR